MFCTICPKQPTAKGFKQTDGRDGKHRVNCPTDCQGEKHEHEWAWGWGMGTGNWELGTGDWRLGHGYEHGPRAILGKSMIPKEDFHC